MADYFTHFSCILDVGSTDNVARAFTLYEEYGAELERDDGLEPGFDIEVDPNSDQGLWFRGDGYGEPEHVIAFVLRCAEAFDLKGRWGFVWSLTCTKPMLDGFGGGAQLLDLGERRTLAWLDCTHWLDVASGDDVDPSQGVGLG